MRVGNLSLSNGYMRKGAGRATKELHESPIDMKKGHLYENGLAINYTMALSSSYSSYPVYQDIFPSRVLRDKLVMVEKRRCGRSMRGLFLQAAREGWESVLVSLSQSAVGAAHASQTRRTH
jgi:hypothetical protein